MIGLGSDKNKGSRTMDYTACTYMYVFLWIPQVRKEKVDIYFHFSWPLLQDVIWVIISTVTPCHFSSLPSTPIHFPSTSRWGGCLQRFKLTIMIIPQFGAVFTIAQKPWNMKQRILFLIFLDGRTLSLKESKSCGCKKAMFDQNSVFAQINDIF